MDEIQDLEYIEQQGFAVFMKQIVNSLEKIGPADYVKTEKDYGDEMERLFLAAVKGEEDEEAFNALVETVDQEYHKLDGHTQTLLERYFEGIHLQLIEVVEE